MNLFTGEASDEFFGSEAPPAVRRLLEQAQGGVPDAQVEVLLWTAQASAPACLAVYYLLYKFHARKREFDKAEQVALRGLAEAAAQAGISAPWQHVQPGMADFLQVGPARFFLFTLKALAFISLRQRRPEAASAYLAKVCELDPAHGAGGEVIASLLSAAGAARP